MTATHLTLTLIASIAALGGAVLNLTGHRIPVTEAQRLSVPLEWLSFPIGGRDIGRNLLLNATLSLVLCVAVLVFCFLR